MKKAYCSECGSFTSSGELDLRHSNSVELRIGKQFLGCLQSIDKVTILMFRSGRAVCTGGKNEDNIQTGIERRFDQECRNRTWDLRMLRSRFRTW